MDQRSHCNNCMVGEIISSHVYYVSWTGRSSPADGVPSVSVAVPPRIISTYTRCCCSFRVSSTGSGSYSKFPTGTHLRKQIDRMGMIQESTPQSILSPDTPRHHPSCVRSEFTCQSFSSQLSSSISSGDMVDRSGWFVNCGCCSGFGRYVLSVY